jgi:hypothetical protein
METDGKSWKPLEVLWENGDFQKLLGRIVFLIMVTRKELRN